MADEEDEEEAPRGQFRAPSSAAFGIEFTRSGEQQQHDDRKQHQHQHRRRHHPDHPRRSGAAAVDAAAAPAPSARADARAHLPAASHLRELLFLVERHSAVVVVGATGAGKTTQIPQYLLAAGWARAGRTVCVAVPRPLAAQRAAERVAEELLAAAAGAGAGAGGGGGGGAAAATAPAASASSPDLLLGADGRPLVGTYLGGGGGGIWGGGGSGFGGGGGEATSPSSPSPPSSSSSSSYAAQALCFTTPDALLAAMASGDPLLASCSVLVVVEAHERGLATDALLGLLRQGVMRRRPELRVVVASATLDAAALAGFFSEQGEEGGGGGGGEGGTKQEEEEQEEQQGDGRASEAGPPPSSSREGRKRRRADGEGGGGRRHRGATAATAATTATKKTRSPEKKGGGGLPVSRDAAVLSLQGRQHPVQLHYLHPSPCADYVRAATEACWALHSSAGVPGDAIVFLPGKEQAAACAAMLRELAAAGAAAAGGGGGGGLSGNSHRDRSAPTPPTRLLVRPLHAGLPASAVRAALEPAPRGCRKAVVAAGPAAETGLTLEGVVHVIDACFARVRAHNPATGLSAVVVAPEDHATAAQRAGRAGRERAGHCFRLCTQGDFSRLLPARAAPEAQRSDLSPLLLRLKALGVDDLAGFAWPAPPPPEALVRGLETLAALGALELVVVATAEEEQGRGGGGGRRQGVGVGGGGGGGGGVGPGPRTTAARLTVPLGVRMAALLPLPPMVARFVLAACERGAGAEEAVVVASLLAAGSGGGGGGGGGGAGDGGGGAASELTGGGVWASRSSSPASASHQRELERRVRLFGAAEGDLVALLNAFLAWKGRGGGGVGGGGGGGGSGGDDGAAAARQRRQRAAAWASRRGLNVGALVAADRTAAALRRAVRRMGFFGGNGGNGSGGNGGNGSGGNGRNGGGDDGRAPLPSAEGDVDPLLRAVAAGFFLNAAVFERTEYVDPLLEAVAGARGGQQQQQQQRRGGGGGAGAGAGASSSSLASGGGGPREVHVYRLLRDPLRGLGGTGGPRLRIHPSSVLARASPPPPCVVFCAAAQVSGGGGGSGGAGGGRGAGASAGQQGRGVWADMSGVTAIEARWLAEAAPHVFRRAVVDGGRGAGGAGGGGGGGL